MTDRDIMQQALEALEAASDIVENYTRAGYEGEFNEAITALRERLVQPEKEPKCGAIIEVFGKDWRLDYMSLPVGKHKLYTQQYTYNAPPQRKPPQFPTMLRKMWSGAEVQKWINENWEQS